MNGVKFGFMHSYDFLKIVLNEKEIGLPEIKTNIIEIPGADGVVDMTDFFGETKYTNRILKFKFTISPLITQKEYIKTFHNVYNILHGTKRKIILDDEPDYYYFGRVSVGNYKCEKGIATFEMVCDCEPFKTETIVTTVTQNVNGVATVELYNTRKRVVPTITASTEFLFKYDGVYYDGLEGTFTLPEIELVDGYNYVEVTGVGTVTFSYEKGRL
jgi:predicted phage tail component-like protein